MDKNMKRVVKKLSNLINRRKFEITDSLAEHQKNSARILNQLHEGFSLLYNRAPLPDELARLDILDIIKSDNMQDILRRIIAASDRQIYETPFLIRFGGNDITWKLENNIEIALDTADIAVSRYVSEGAYEPHLTSFFKKTIRPGMYVADVGANIGYYSILSANLVGPTGRVFSFEPNSENARLILISKEKNKSDNITLYPAALSDKTGHLFFSPHLGSNGGISPSTLEVLLSSQCIVVPTMCMDNIIENKIDFIKIDVEGAEGLVIAGARRLISNCRPIITMEYSPEMLSRVSQANPLELLKSMKYINYSISVLDRTDNSGSLIPIDDVDVFVNEYGSTIRIEDLVFLP